MTENLEHYKIFYYTAKHGSVTAAAAALSVSQPAVSQAVKGLEESLGCKLFLRTSKGVKLTPEGETLFTYVSSGYGQIETGVRLLEKQRDLEMGLIRVGASDMTLRFYLLPFLESFHEKHPEVRIQVSNGPTPETLRLLEEGRIDFGVVSSPVEKRNGLEVREVKKIRDAFVAGPGYERLKGKTLSFQELQSLPVILLEKNTSARSSLDALLSKYHVILIPEFELATSDMIVQFALRSLGIGNVMRGFAEEYLSCGKLFELRFQEEIPCRSFCVATQKNNPLSAAAAGLLALLPQTGEP